MQKDERYCRICGFDYGIPIWANGIPSHDICPCCDAEVGIEDFTLESVHQYRTNWLREGGKWRAGSSYNSQPFISDLKYKPEGWSREEQMKNIPPEWL